jgi:hypothetical protein
MEANPVSRAVNNPRTDSPDCVESITDLPPTGASPKAKKSKGRQNDTDEPTLF